MSETEPTPTPDPTRPVTPPPTPARPRRRRWVRWVLALLVLLVVGTGLLAVAAPTLVGFGPVKNAILARVNARLNGRVEVDSLSVGWTTGVHLGGVRVFDAEHVQIAGLDRADVPVSLLGAIRGRYALGDTVIDGLSADARYDAAGRLNFAELVKSDGPPATTPAKPAAPPKSEPSKLPDVSGTVTIKNCRATVSQPGKPTDYLSDVGGTVKIPDLNQPIADQLAATVKVGDGPASTVKAAGTVAAIKGGKVDVNAADVHQTVDVAGLDAAAAKPFLSATQRLNDVGGRVNLHLSVDATGGKTVVAVLKLDGTDVRLDGPALSGDTYRSSALLLSIPKLTGEFPNGLADWEAAHLTTAEPALFKVDQADLTLSADAPVPALLNVLANKVPGATGSVDLTTNADLAKLARAVPDLLKLQKGVTLTGGTVKQTLAVKMVPARTTLAGSLDLTGLAGTRPVDGGPATPVAVSDVHANFAATDLGGTGGAVLPDVRDVSAGLRSAFANGDLKGTTLADLTGKLTVDLSRALAEANQFVDTNGLQLAGTVTATVADKGDLLNDPRQATVDVTVAGRNLVAQPKDGTRLDEKAIDLALAAVLHGSADKPVEHATGVKLTATVGDAATPTVAVLFESADLSLTGGASPFSTKLTAPDLAKLQRELAAVAAGKAGTVLTGGTLTASVAGTYAATHIDLTAVDVDGSASVARQLPTGQQVVALTNDAVKVHAAAVVDQTPGGDRTVRVSALTVADSAKLVSVTKSSGGDLTVTTKADGGYAGGGQVSVAADLAGVNRVRNTLGMTDVAVQTPAGTLSTGQFAGTVTLSTAAGGAFTADGQFRAGNLVVVTPTGALPAQSLAIVAKATYDPVAKTVAVDEASVKGACVTGSITKAALSLDQKEMLDKVTSAHFDLNVTDLRTLAALAAAFQKPTPTPVGKATPPAAAPPAATPEPPRVFDAGTVAVSGDLSHSDRTTNLTTSIDGKSVAFHKGTVAYQMKPFSVQLAASAEGGGGGDTLLKQVRQVTVSKLAGDLAGAGTLSMPTPITVTSPAASPVATGAVEVKGKLADLAPLAAAWQGKPADAYPYRGDYDLTESVTSQASTVTLKGGVTVANFQSMNGAAVAFAEPKLSVANDLDYVTVADDADVAIRSLAVDFQQTKALNFTVANGSVKRLDTDRQLDLVAAIDIDWAKAWPAVQPLVGAKYKDAKMAGLWQRKLTVGGSYPAGKPFEQAVVPLVADGSVVVGSFDYSGLILKNFDLPFTIRGGKLVTAKPLTDAVVTVNDGKAYFDGVTVDLASDPMRVSTPDNKIFLSHATVNPLFTGTFLQAIVNNPAFVGVNQATGLLDLTIVHCDRLPAGALVEQAGKANDGSATVALALTDLNIGSSGLGAVIGGVTQLINNDAHAGAAADSFSCNVTGTVTLAHGVAQQDVTFKTGKYALPFVGGVALADKSFRGYTVGVPGQALARVAKLDPRIAGAFPETVAIPVNGFLSAPQPDVGGAVNLQVQRIAADPTKLLGGFLNGNKGAGGNAAQPPAADDPAKAVGDLLNGFGKKKKR